MTMETAGAGTGRISACMSMELGMESPSFLRFGLPSEVKSLVYLQSVVHSQAAKLLCRWWEGGPCALDQ